MKSSLVRGCIALLVLSSMVACSSADSPALEPGAPGLASDKRPSPFGSPTEATASRLVSSPRADFSGRKAVLGIHDGAINFCDHFEHWGNGPPDYAAVAGDMGNEAWWTPLNVATVRVSVPWDIALPWSSKAGLVTAHDPADWAPNHAAALKDEQTCFDYLLHAARAAGQVVDVAFKPDYDYRDPSTNHILAPDIDTYRAAIAAFVGEYNRCDNGETRGGCIPTSGLNGGPGPADMATVHIITPWGEPDYGNGSYPLGSNDRTPGCSNGCQGNSLAGTISAAKEVFFLPGGSSGMDPNRARFDDPNCRGTFTDAACGPVLAAQMWMAIYHACPGCVLSSGPTEFKPNSGIVAGDFSGGGGLDSNGGPKTYLETYAEHLNDCPGCQGVRPLTWGFHPYPDASNEEWCLTTTGHDYEPEADGGSHSQTVRVLNALDAVGYHEGTYLWLDEVSVFAKDNYAHTSPSQPVADDGRTCRPNRSGSNPLYTPAVERDSFLWLYRKLPQVLGTSNPGHEPVIDRIYYFRAFPANDGNGDNISPVNPSVHAQQLYNGIVNRD